MKKDMMEEAMDIGKKDEGKKEQISKGKITSMHMRKLDDGSWNLSSHTMKGHSQETSHPNVNHLMHHVQNNLTSPHLPKLGSGKRFDMLSSKLAKNPKIKNPDAVAGAIGRKKYGKKKFQSLVAHGKSGY